MKFIVSVKLYIQEKKVQTEEKKTVTTVATVPAGIIATVRNLKKKGKKPLLVPTFYFYHF